jgi:hypothetical protein
MICGCVPKTEGICSKCHNYALNRTSVSRIGGSLKLCSSCLLDEILPKEIRKEGRKIGEALVAFYKFQSSSAPKGGCYSSMEDEG